MERGTGNSVTCQRSVSCPLLCGPTEAHSAGAHLSQRPKERRETEGAGETDGQEGGRGAELDNMAGRQHEEGRKGGRCQPGAWGGRGEGRGRQPTAGMTGPRMSPDARVITGSRAERPAAAAV